MYFYQNLNTGSKKSRTNSLKSRKSKVQKIINGRKGRIKDPVFELAEAKNQEAAKWVFQDKEDKAHLSKIEVKKANEAWVMSYLGAETQDRVQENSHGWGCSTFQP